MTDQIDPGAVSLQVGALVLHLIADREAGVRIQIDDPRLPGSPLLPTRALTGDEWRAVQTALQPPGLLTRDRGIV